jgi:hypothetical protein
MMTISNQCVDAFLCNQIIETIGVGAEVPLGADVFGTSPLAFGGMPRRWLARFGHVPFFLVLTIWAILLALGLHLARLGYSGGVFCAGKYSPKPVMVQ